MGYPEGGGEHVIIVLNGVWIGTVVNASAAEALAQFLSTLAAVPAENMGWAPLEEVRSVAARYPDTTPATPA